MIAPPPAPPLAMRSRLGETAGCWLEVNCGQCRGSTRVPVKLLAQKYGAGRQLGAIVCRLTCKRCHVPPAEVWLNETHKRERHGGAEPGWTVRLV